MKNNSKDGKKENKKKKTVYPLKKNIYSNKKGLHKGQPQPENEKPLYAKYLCLNFKLLQTIMKVVCSLLIVSKTPVNLVNTDHFYVL